MKVSSSELFFSNVHGPEEGLGPLERTFEEVHHQRQTTTDVYSKLAYVGTLPGFLGKCGVLPMYLIIFMTYMFSIIFDKKPVSERF